MLADGEEGGFKTILTIEKSVNLLNYSQVISSSLVDSDPDPWDPYGFGPLGSIIILYGSGS